MQTPSNNVVYKVKFNYKPITAKCSCIMHCTNSERAHCESHQILIFMSFIAFKVYILHKPHGCLSMTVISMIFHIHVRISTIRAKSN